MRVSTSHLQQLAIFTTVLTGGGVGTMYYLLQTYHRLALQKLEECPVAMETLGAPPLKVYNIHLSDRHNRMDRDTAQMKIPVTGSNTGGYLYVSSVRDPDTNSGNNGGDFKSLTNDSDRISPILEAPPPRWSLEQAVLKLREGATINLLTPPPPAATHTQTTEHTLGLDTGH
ncbi:cytochrome c oxidase assembly factor 1 homolog isoform X2 [Trachinotus anak]|uniref:cytochrome c oxidase assembly factor 1 homolog isoform X2 n=1 Tax=Trachinotus anak TaxID=443729 RepID=UPI0039F1F0D0